ncbi:outer membrane lipoprotein-sorting protein [Rickettsiales bacterium]|nr:outer membrane lipoprotein-sorting protein [Rickettsiales bacterium]
MKKIITAISIFLLSSGSVFAKSADEVLASASTPEEQGKAIAIEADARDFGFGDMEVDLDMTLRNAHGQEIKRTQRNKTLEVTDPSVGDKSLIIFDNPRDVKGTAFLTFSKILEPDDQWLYLPSLKRVKRISSKNKSGPFVGSEFAYEDISSQEVEKYTYKYLRKEACGKMECFVVERYPAYEYSGYTKQVAWIDTKEFRPIKIDFYDRKSELLKTLTYEGYKQYLGKYWRADKFLMVNHQTGKSTEIAWKNYRFNVGLQDSDFTQANLKRVK